jgi:periplasmic divalent cation tolerance protein
MTGNGTLTGLHTRSMLMRSSLTGVTDAQITSYVLVSTVIDDREAADRIAETVVGARLAACAQVTGPVTSTYWWNDQVETAQEWAVTFKTTSALAEAVVTGVKNIHTYDVPEILVTPIVAGHGDYLAWISAETAASTPAAN